MNTIWLCLWHCSRALERSEIFSGSQQSSSGTTGFRTLCPSPCTANGKTACFDFYAFMGLIFDLQGSTFFQSFPKFQHWNIFWSLKTLFRQSFWPIFKGWNSLFFLELLCRAAWSLVEFFPISLYKKSIFGILLFLNYFMLKLVPGGVSLENPVLRTSSFNNSCTV